MWYPATITTPPASEPVSADEVKAQTDITFADDDALIALLVAGARAFVEKYCGIRLVTQTITVQCESFNDMTRFPEAPAQSVVSISYIDIHGEAQTLPTSVYEMNLDGLEPSITLKYEQAWPQIRSGSRITVVAAVGYADVPPDIKRALLLYIAEAYADRENGKASDWTAFDSLLCNHRRNA